jgi:hypothetical protein
MGYGFDLVRVPTGLSTALRRAEAARVMEARAAKPFDTSEQRLAMPPSAEQARLAGLLRALFPKLIVTHESANWIELKDEELSTQISIFEDAAKIATNPGGFSVAKYVEAARFVWQCLELLESEAGLATYDPQVGRVLSLAKDFEIMLETLSGKPAVKLYRKLLEGYEHQLSVAQKGGPVKPYSAKTPLAVGELVEHPSFGVGVVRAVALARATVQFPAGTKVLVCG